MPRKVKEKNTQTSEKLTMFDKATRNIFSFLDNNYTDKQILNEKDQKLRSILNRELELTKGVSQGSIIDFVSSLNMTRNKNMPFASGQNNQPNTNDLFTKNINDIFGYFQDIYKNKYIEMDDLMFISKFIPALGEAVSTTLDSMVSSDNVSESVNLSFNLPGNIAEEDRDAILSEIEREEDDLKLRKKIKNIVFKKTLVTGLHYVYAKSYNSIFEEYDVVKKKREAMVSQGKTQQFSSGYGKKETATESSTFMKGAIDYAPALENIQSIFNTSKTTEGTKLSKNIIHDRMSSFYNSLPEVNFDISTVYSEAMESVSTLVECPSALEAFQKIKDKKASQKSTTKKKDPLTIQFPDGTKDINNKNAKDPTPSKFNITGTYIKYINAKNLIPLKVFEQVIGYYLIHPKNKKKNSNRDVTGITSIGNTLFSALNIGEEKKQDAIQKVVDTISEGIMNSFDKKFVTENAEYKKMIADCVIANGLIDKDYNIQFIPESDIIPFVIQENEDGFGESILINSIFPGKALLSMIVTRMLNYINKTGNKTIGHVHRSKVDPLDNNRLNRVIRDLQDQDITFNDLLSPNLLFNKFNRDGNYLMPTSVDGARLIEFETQEGQNIDMTPEYEKILQDMTIMGTSVPTVIMEYVGSADFQKQIVSAHIKFADHIANLQSDVEPSLTTLYKKICANSNLSDAQKLICEQSLTVSLPKPRALKNTNDAEYLDTLTRSAEAIADLKLGRDSVTNTDVFPNGQLIKEKLMYRIARQNAPFIDWDEIDDAEKEVRIEVSEFEMRKDSSNEMNENMGDNPF